MSNNDISATTLPIVDAHHHLWNLSDPNHHYTFLRPDTPNDFIAGDRRPLKSTYSIQDYIKDTGPYNVVKSVHVEAAYDIHADPWGDIEWLYEQAKTNKNQLPNVLVAHANLADDQVRERLATLTNRFDKVRGIRHLINWLDSKESKYTLCDRPDYLTDDKWKQGFGLLNQYGLSFDLAIYHHQMNDAAQLARENLDTTIILDHCGMPYDNMVSINQWKAGMAALAQQPNVSCKLSGLVMFQHNWTAESLRPFLECALNVFGVDRCLFASNFPVDKLHATFGQLVEANLQVAKEVGLSKQEIERIFHDNAFRIYRL
ncbi:unnamed protein product [Rotaria sordida]|uniref:Amidohydrolase-related domain-containing protein n=1 Tax=Rotaria sordida TaxID=392033 RepID=A0A813P9Q9_9BILA|nr:unnamed protein product [Rotaria sordida]CAF1318074.1 unnamed protein product [Rotaria sordida]